MVLRTWGQIVGWRSYVKNLVKCMFHREAGETRIYCSTGESSESSASIIGTSVTFKCEHLNMFRSVT